MLAEKEVVISEASRKQFDAHENSSNPEKQQARKHLEPKAFEQTQGKGLPELSKTATIKANLNFHLTRANGKRFRMDASQKLV